MKRFAITFFTIMCAVLFASTTEAANVDATKILDKTAARISIAKGVRMNFAIANAKFSQKGALTVKGTKFRASTASAEIWYDGKTQWTYNKANDEVNIAAPSASVQQQMNPYYFLNLYKQPGYAKTATATRNGYEIHLTGKGKGISEMYVSVDKGYNLKQVKFKQGGSWTTITVSNIRSASVADSYFRFNSKDYPKAEVIDLR